MIFSTGKQPHPSTLTQLLRNSLTENSIRLEPIAGCRKSIYCGDNTTKRSRNRTTVATLTPANSLISEHSTLLPEGEEKWRTQVMKCCRQNNVVDFNRLYTPQILAKCKKIGEGTYGEVFLNTHNQTVMKIIPIEGELEVNGEVQKTYEQIAPEIIISMELAALRACKRFTTPAFVGVKNVSVVLSKFAV